MRKERRCFSPPFSPEQMQSLGLHGVFVAGSGLVGLHMHAKTGYGLMGSSVNVYDLR